MRWSYLIDALERRGWETEIYSSRHNPTRDTLSDKPSEARLAEARAQVMARVGRAIGPLWRRAGVQPEAFPANHLWSWTARRGLRRRIEELRPDIVVATIPPPAALFAAAAVAPAAGIPLVVDMRDNWAGHPTYDAGGRVLTRIEGRALRQADAIVGVTTGMAARLRRLHPWIEPRLQLLPNGFDPRLIDERVGASAWPDRVTLIHPGVLYGDRGVGALLRAMGEPDLRDRVRLELVGNVDPGTATELAARRHGVEVDVTGPRPWRATMDRVAAADIVAVIVPASMGDDVAWPVKLFEGLALGKPILSITSGGATETLLREIGQDHALARDGDADSIAEALRGLLAGPPPAPATPAQLTTWDREAVAERYAALLERLAKA